MNTFKRKALTSAVLAGLGVAGTAHAVYLNPNGQGQALIYPYYTVQSAGGNSYNTYISVVNTTTVVKVVKVRFREGKNSREVLDYNLYLSPNDVFTGAVVPSSDAATAGGRFVTTDTSCTNPAIPDLGGGLKGIDFRNYLYSGANAEAAGVNEGLDRSREGYAEIIEMGTLAATSGPGTAAVHGASGSPTCTGLTGQAVPAVAGAITVPTGGMNGTGTIINVNSGADAGYNADAFANVTAAAIYADIGDDTPNFTFADPVSVVVANNGLYRSDWLLGEDAVSATMMRSNVINEYILDTNSLSQTDWVLTFPTKHHYVDTVTALTPFTNKYVAASGSCEEITFTYFNREERGATAAGADFSPLPPGAAANTICWESTVVSIRNAATHMPTGTSSGVLGSLNTVPVHVAPTFQNGWVNIAFTDTNATTTGLASQATSTTTNALTGVVQTLAQTFLGLPVTGFMVRSLNNSTLTCGTASCQGNYGSLFGHKYTVTVTPAP